MDNDFLQEDNLISSFNGSFRKALGEQTKPTPSDSEVKTEKNKNERRSKKKVNEQTTNNSIQVRVSLDTFQFLKKLQFHEFEKTGKMIPLKELVDSIISDYSKRKKG